MKRIALFVVGVLAISGAAYAQTPDEAIEKANDSIFGLGSSIWTNDLNRATRAAERIEAGYTWINSAQIIYDELPFGGFKQSGLGKEHGTEALDYYTETKSVVVSTKSSSPEAK